jgi:CheY-like chemotaxis protein
MYSILVVDDDEDIREALSSLLSAGGYLVSTAANGREALDRIDRSAPPHVIILDLVMPDMTGFELLAALRKDPELRQCYVVVVSASDRAPGADAFFQKPYAPSALLAKVQQLCLASTELETLAKGWGP